MLIKDIINQQKSIDEVIVKGWVNANRGNEKIRFISINDGSCFENLQCVLKDKLSVELENLRLGSALELKGEIKLTPEAKQPLELVVSEIILSKSVDEDFPFQKQEMNLETIREIPHLRSKTNTFRAIMRIRSTLAQEIHSFFASKNFLYVSSPIITGNDGEGAGEAFVVDDEGKDMFFGKKATLGVTGQLHAEAYANGFGNVYTFAPTFRAEKSHTQKHAAEFWMIEPEMAFTNYKEAIAFADELLKTSIKNTISKHKLEMAFLSEKFDSNLLNKLNNFLDKKMQIISYEEVIKILLDNKDNFEVKDLKFGTDLGTEHERFIAEKIFNSPVAIVNYPKDIKAFYMKQNSDGKTVDCFDILVPGIGELVGGSERETDIDKLKNRMREINIPEEDLEWYIDLRRFGLVESSGFGIGFERLVMYVTGVNNIRDVIPFPRTPGTLKM